MKVETIFMLPNRKHSARHLSVINMHFRSLTKFTLLSITTSFLLSLSDQVKGIWSTLLTIKYYTNVSYYNEITFNFNLPQQCLRKLRKQVLSIQRPEFESKVKEKQERTILQTCMTTAGGIMLIILRKSEFQGKKNNWGSYRVL